MPGEEPVPEFDTIFFDNGDYYEGETLNRLPHGNGTMYYDNGETIRGVWHYGLKICYKYPDTKIPYCDDPSYLNKITVKENKFCVGYCYNHKDIAEAFEISTYISGIRIHRDTAVLFSLDNGVYRDGIGWYEDFDGQKIFKYTGEGLEGDEKMTRGNYFLGNSYGKNIYLFVKYKAGEYTFHGKVRVKRIEDAQEPDKYGKMRSVYKFILERV